MNEQPNNAGQPPQPTPGTPTQIPEGARAAAISEIEENRKRTRPSLLNQELGHFVHLHAQSEVEKATRELDAQHTLTVEEIRRQNRQEWDEHHTDEELEQQLNQWKAVVERLATAEICPSCGGQGWFPVGCSERLPEGSNQQQCECVANPKSLFNALTDFNNLLASEKKGGGK